MTSATQPLSIFVSHAKEDVAFARRLTQSLGQASIRVWLAETELKVGDSIVEAIDTAIKRTDVLVAILSRTSRKAKWFQYEIEHAQQKGGIEIFIVCIDGTELPSDLANYTCIRGNDADTFPYEDLVSQLKERFPEAGDYEEPEDTIPQLPLLVGRADALHRLEEMASQHRSIAITGMGGIGKSVLAAAFARWARETNLVERVIWLSGSHANAEGLAGEIHRSLRLPQLFETIEEAKYQISNALKSVSALIVLDDATDESLAFMLQLFGDSDQGNLRLLVTSRMHALAGAAHDFVVYNLDTLTSSEAMNFLQELVQDGVELSATNAERIVAETGGHPLALHLVAGQLNSGMPADELIQKIHSGISGLGTANSIKHTLDHTYNTLTEAERETLSSIALFGHTPITIRTLATLSAVRDSSELLSTVQTLAQRGVIHLDEGRISMHPLVQTYMRQKHDSDQSLPLHTLYITLDPTLMAKEDFVEVLEALNGIYLQLGGDELIIREDEIGHFTKEGVLV